jgi:UDP-glucose 4-epimerase
MKKASVLILGGAGFVGSNMAKVFVRIGAKVTVIDGLFRGTGGTPANLVEILPHIRFIPHAVQDVDDLQAIIADQSLIIDAMAWTSHHAALAAPDYDLELNAASHLSVIRHLRNTPETMVIYLGSRSQYGKPSAMVITEETPMVPEDIQGIHKLAGESYYRVYSKLYGFCAISLRFPNCFGEHQPVSGDDIGLIGSFIRDCMVSRTIDVYGAGRKRSVVYVEDVANIAERLTHASNSGFSVYNIGGHHLTIEELAATIIDVVGMGEYRVKELPEEVRAIDVGSALLSDTKLHGVIGPVEYTAMKPALEVTAAYMRKSLS